MLKVMQVFYQVFCDTDLQHRLRRTHKTQIKTQITMNTWEDSHRGRKTDKLCPPFFPKNTNDRNTFCEFQVSQSLTESQGYDELKP
jgi:hypothetical protein